MQIVDNEYSALEQVTGSDHRPVKFEFSIKDFFAQDINNSVGQASIMIESLQLTNIDYDLLKELGTFSEFPLHIRASFVAPWIDYDNQKMVFASSPLVQEGITKVDFDKFPEQLSVSILSKQELASQRMLVLLWARTENGDEEKLIGHVNVCMGKAR
jgi:hypothetical protein